MKKTKKKTNNAVSSATLKPQGQPLSPSPYIPPTPKVDTEVEELTVQQLMQAQNLIQSSNIIWQMQNIMNHLNHGYPLNKWEQQMMDEVLDNYNIQYKTKLTQALK